MTQRLITVLFFLAAISCMAQNSGKIESIQLAEKDVVIRGEDRRGPYLLPDSLIIKDSEQVFLNSQKLEKTDYELDFIAGEIRFSDIVPQNSSIRLIYKILPYSLKKSYAHRRVVQRAFGAPTEAVLAQPISLKSEEPDYGALLNKSGSITRGVTVGTNRGLKVNSSLNINVSGKVAENVQVVAALTDQTTPIQPEGTSQNLQEIDKIFVQVKAPYFAATMGDFQLDYSASEFARYSRKLQGAMGQVQSDNLSVTVSGAVSRGKYTSMQFLGQEGNQGPYQLKGDRGQIDIIILAGTERIFIDGESMTRGETNDYVIDYATAQITFTRRRLITSDSRIVVDFQYSDERFRRNLYSSEIRGRLWDGKVVLGTTLLQESDDKKNPMDFALTDDRLRILSQAGDDPQKAVVDGAEFVGSGQGRYIKTELGFFRHAGRDSGDYRVTFSDVGEGKGDYRYKGTGIYEYVGREMGRYAPVILLPTARSHNLLDFNLHVSPVNSLSLHGEVAFSALDLNTYSGIDDKDNQGTAQNWQLTVKQDSLKMLGVNWGKALISGRIRRVQDRFEDIDRTTEAEYNRRWDLPADSKRGEDVREIQSFYEPLKGAQLSGEWGMIRKGEVFRSNRWQFSSQLHRGKLPHYQYRIEQISKNEPIDRRSGDWLRQRGTASYSLWKLRPMFGYDGEIKKENWSDTLSTGFKFDDYNGGLEFSPISRVVVSTKFSQRRDQDYIGHDRFRDKSTALTQNYALQLQQIKSFSAAMEFTHREKRYSDPAIGDKRTDLAELRAGFSPLNRVISSDFSYQLSNTATAKKERVFIKVTQGDGNYRFDELLNEYVNDPLGDYILRILTTDDFIPVVELKATSRVRLDPARFWSKMPSEKLRARPIWQKMLSAISSESNVAIEERTQEKDVWQIYLMNFSKYRQPETTIFGSLQIRQDLFLFENNRNFSLRLRYRTRDEKNNQFLEGGQDWIERDNSARMTARFSNKWSSQTELTRKRAARIFGYAGRQNRDVYGTQAHGDVSYRPVASVELALESRLSWEEDRFYELPTRVRALAFVPRANYSLRGKGRLSAEVEWSNVSVEPAGRIIPYEMANGRSIGQSVRWDIRFDYRFSTTIQATFSYSGRSEPERHGTIHTGRAQVTAAFR